LAGLLAYFLRVSWRKWPDPIVDSSQEWYAAWRIAEGGRLFHEGRWNYGPLSAYFNGELFRVFGSNLTVLFTANLLIYAAILVLTYMAFRRAWGWLGAFAACAVFISIFSFSHLTSIGNYNYAAPYSHSSTHGILLMFVALFVAAAWCRGESPGFALLLGICGGIAAVLKPEFMLAMGMVGAGALALRFLQRNPVSAAEWALLVAGAMAPTLLFTLGFWTHEPFSAAFAHASNAWWRVVVKPIASPGFVAGQSLMAGFDHPWRNGWTEFKDGVCAIIVLAAIWAAGCFINSPASKKRIALLLIFGGIAVCLRLDGGWFRVGRCILLPALLIVAFTAGRLVRACCKPVELPPSAIMQWLLALFSVAMLARMPLFVRVYHFGFFQAAPAAMLIAAVTVAEIPCWVGKPRAGRIAAAVCGLFVLTLPCISIAARSNGIRAEQTQQIAVGLDRFYAFNVEVDTTGALVDWVVKRLATEPPGRVLVVPDGLSINFLSRRISASPEIGASWPAERQIQELRNSPPKYVVEISLDLTERGIRQWGTEGNPGYILVKWVNQNYVPVTSWGEPFSGTNLKGARILRRKTP
jgi:hypothetical protein